MLACSQDLTTAVSRRQTNPALGSRHFALEKKYRKTVLQLGGTRAVLSCSSRRLAPCQWGGGSEAGVAPPSGNPSCPMGVVLTGVRMESFI